MKVRILSGNLKGTVVEQPQLEAEANISTGFAEIYNEEDQAALDLKVSGKVPEAKPLKPAAPAKPGRKVSGRKATTRKK